MQRIKRIRPTPAGVLSVIALFAVLGGTGVAASKINGSKLKNRSVSHTRIKKNTLTGVEIKESKLGTIPGVQKSCQPGAVRGYAQFTGGGLASGGAYINLSPSVAFNCAGQPVQVRKAGTGSYRVRFVGNPSIFGTGTPNGNVNADTDNIISVGRVADPKIGNEQVFIVHSQDVNGAGSAAQDSTPTIVIY